MTTQVVQGSTRSPQRSSVLLGRDKDAKVAQRLIDAVDEATGGQAQATVLITKSSPRAQSRFTVRVKIGPDDVTYQLAGELRRLQVANLALMAELIHYAVEGSPTR